MTREVGATMRRALYLVGIAALAAVACVLIWSNGMGGSSGTSGADAKERAKEMLARVRLPLLLSQAADPTEAIPAAQEHLRANPEDAGAWALLGTAYTEKARRSGDPAYYPKAQGALERSLKLQPRHNYPAMVGMGTLANSRHAFAHARDWALKIQKENAYHAPLYGVLADAHLNLGDLDAATDATQRMLDLQPGVGSFLRGANVYEQKGEVRDAEDLARRALSDAVTAHDAAFCHHRLGDLAWNSGRPHHALRSYERALKADPAHVPALLGKARAQAALGRADAALRDYATAVQRLPQPQYLLEYGEYLQSLGRYDEAERQYAAFTAQERLAKEGGVVDDLTTGQYEADHGDPNEAVQRLEAELARRPSPVVIDAYAWALHRTGRDTEALAQAERADDSGVRSALFAYHRGEIERALGRWGDAERHLDRALRVNPHFSPLLAPQAKRALAGLYTGQ